MDGLRGTWGDAGGDHASDYPGIGHHDTDFPGIYELEDDLDLDGAIVEPPPSSIGQDERRLQVRAYNLWASLLDERNFPGIADLHIAELPDFAPNAVLLDFSRGVDNPRIGFLGEGLAQECGASTSIRRLSDVPGRSLLSRITDHYMQILANQAPIGFEAEFVNQRDRTVLYRGILLPFSEDGETIGHILGVINWKELVDQHTTDALLHEIDQALRDAPAPSRTPLPVPVIPGGLALGDAPGSDLPVIPPIDPSGEDAPAPTAWPEPMFGGSALAPTISADDAVNGAVAGLPAVTLAACLASARDLAAAAAAGEDRSRIALYAAIGRAHDVALAAAAAPTAFAELLAETGLTRQERAPHTPVVKLVFGPGYEKTRLTEYAAALAHAERLGLTAGTLAGYLAATPGGLKAVVTAERAIRSGEAPAPLRQSPRAGLARKLRRLTPVAFDALAGAGEEFTLLVARRVPGAELIILGEVVGEPALFDRAARRIIARR